MVCPNHTVQLPAKFHLITGSKTKPLCTSYSNLYFNLGLKAKPLPLILALFTNALSEDVIQEKEMVVGKNTDNPMKIKVPYMDLHHHTVWGATGVILSEFKDLIS